LRDEQGRRPVYGGAEKFQTDPHWRDHLLFYEYFHGDNGAGAGRQPPDRLDRARAKSIQLYGLLDPKGHLRWANSPRSLRAPAAPGGRRDESVAQASRHLRDQRVVWLVTWPEIPGESWISPRFRRRSGNAIPPMR